MHRDIADTVGKAGKWKTRNWRQEGGELTVGASAAGVGFTRFLGNSAHAFRMAGSVATALPIVGTAFAGADVIVSGVSIAKTHGKMSAWKELASKGDVEQGKTVETQLKALRGKSNSEALATTNDASVKFALDPCGTTGGKSRLSGMTKDEQLGQLARIGKYAADKAQRKMGRKGAEGTLGSLAFAFGAASLATGVVTPPGILFGALSMGFGIARGASKVACWIKAAFKSAKGTLGQARERNGNALLELATNSGSQVKKLARDTLGKLGISEKQLDAIGNDPNKRKAILISIMTAMRS